MEKLKALFGKALSRKLLVFLVASAFVLFGVIDSWIWMTIGLTYMGAEGISDIVSRMKK